jgi:hypothetical protein
MKNIILGFAITAATLAVGNSNKSNISQKGNYNQ